MIISVNRGMTALKEQLEQKGYKVVYSDEYKHPVDARIYTQRESAAPFHSYFGAPETVFDQYACTAPADGILHGDRYNGGVFEINAVGKNVDDIERLLIQRRQTDYFY